MDFDTIVRLAIMDDALKGHAPTVTSVARDVGASIDDVAAAFDRLAAGRAIVLEPGTRHILMAAPLSGNGTDFVVRIGQRSVYANCIWDALGIPAMLAGAGRPATVRIETHCADCARLLGLDVRDGNLTFDQPDPVVHFAVPAAQWWADIVFT